MKKTSLIFSFLVCISNGSFAQNVGIGTSTPAYKLDVKNGSINTDSLYRISSFTVLATSGTGNLLVGRQAGLVNTGSLNSFAGHNSGMNNTTGSSNSFFGTSSGLLNTIGNANSFFGTNAGRANVSGSDNSFFGESAGFNNSSGSRNCYFGRYAGLANTTGYSNVAIGNAAMFNNSSGFLQVAIGDSALFNSTSGFRSTAIGGYALFSADSSTNNTAIGYSTLYGNQSGYSNTAIGSQAMSTSIGFRSTAVGDESLALNFGNENVAVGYHSLWNSAGSQNVGVGFRAKIEEGNNSTVLGANASAARTSGTSYATAIGASAVANCNNCLVLGGYDEISRTKVGININTPVTDLHIIQQSVNNFDNTRGIRLQRPGGNQWRVFLDPLNNYVFQYNNNVYAYIEPTNGSFISSSDIRLKKDISSMEQVLDKLLLLQPKTYHYKASEDASHLSYGFLAQEVEKLFPDFVFSSENGMKGIAYSNFSVIAVKAIQEQQQLIEVLMKKNEELERRIVLLEKK